MATLNMRVQKGTYIDQKGRTRWYGNGALADQFKRLYDFLVIGNYDEGHAARYPRLAHTISRYPESIQALKKENRLQEIPGVSTIIAGIICEFLESGTCSKMEKGDEFFSPPPKSVLELTAVSRLGAKTAKMLYQQHGIANFVELADAAEDGSLEKIRGIGASMVQTILEHRKTTK